MEEGQALDVDWLEVGDGGEEVPEEAEGLDDAPEEVGDFREGERGGLGGGHGVLANYAGRGFVEKLVVNLGNMKPMYSKMESDKGKEQSANVSTSAATDGPGHGLAPCLIGQISVLEATAEVERCCISESEYKSKFVKNTDD